MGKYQRGSIRKVGSSWEWRYRIRGVMHQESFSVSQFTNEGALWKHLEPAIARLNSGEARPIAMAATMDDLAKKYQEEYLPKLAKSTQDILSDRPHWSSVLHKRHSVHETSF